MKLLIVDDELLTRDGIADCLRNEYGIDRIAKADCGAAALNMIEAFRPDIMLTDIRMPLMDGIELASQVRQALPDCILMFMSGYSDKAYLKSAINLKALTYIEKPIDVDELREALQQAVGLKQDELRNLQQAESLQRSVQASLPLMKAEIAEELLSARADPGRLRDKAGAAGIALPAKGHFRTVIVKLIAREPFPAVDAALSRRVLHEAERLFALERYSVLALLKDETTLVLHLFAGGRPVGRETLAAVCRKLAAEAGAAETLRLTMTAGPHVGRPERLAESYSAAASLLPRSFYKSSGAVIDAEARAAAVPAAAEDADAAVAAFIRAARERDGQAAQAAIAGFASRLRQLDDTPVEAAKDSFLRMLSALFEKDEPLRRLLTDGMPLWERISRFRCVDDLEAFAGRAASLHLAAAAADPDQAPAPRIVREAVRHIEQSYADEKLCIQSISDHIYVTPTYLCSLFKVHTGLTINAFITRHRIAKASMLLSDPKLSVHQIARLVGFSNSNYFAKVFRKATGLKPSEYRENVPV